MKNCSKYSLMSNDWFTKMTFVSFIVAIAASDK